MLSPASTVTDVDDINLVAGEVRIVSGEVSGDLLTVGGLQSGTFSGIDFSYDAIRHSLTFTGPTAVADYQAFLQAVEFFSTSDNPTDSGLSPTRTLSWFVFDGDALNDAQTTVVSVTAVNDAPVAQDGSNSSNEDTPISGTLVATDVDSPSLIYSLSTQAAHGNVAVNADGTYTYTPNADFTGADSFTFTANDGTADSNAATISLTVNPVNDAPVNTVPGAQAVNEDTALPISGVSVADVDGDTLTTTLSLVNGTLHVTAGTGVSNNDTASVTITGAQTEINAALAGLSYTGSLNFNGADTLTVSTSDGTAQDTSTVAITVNPINDPPTVTVPNGLSVNEDRFS